MLDEKTVNDFQRDGVVLLKGVFDDWIEALRLGVEVNMQSPGPFTREYTAEQEGGRFFGDYCNWERIEQYRDFVMHSPCAELAAGLMQSRGARFFHEHVLVKEPGTDKPTPWHHDQPYYCVDGEQTVSFWIPLDRVPRQTCPEFIVGSHRWGQWFTPTRFTGVQYEREDDTLNSMPDIEANRDDYDIRSWSLEPGDAIAFHFLTVHGAPANLSTEHRRRGFAARWVGDDAVFAHRSGIISPPFPGLEQRLKPGQPLTGDEFPLVYSAA